MANASVKLAARRPIHVGTRVFNADEEGFKVLAAFPVYRGEVVERIAIEALSIAKDDGNNLDQPPIYASYMMYKQMDMSQTAVTTAYLDNVLQIQHAVSGSEYLGGEPNPGGNVSWGDAGWGFGRTIFRRMTMGLPIPTGRDGLNNGEGRYFDSFKSVIKRPFEVPAEGIVMYGVRSPRLDAQTDFGVAEIDNTLDRDSIIRAYNAADLSTQGVGTQKAGELLFGGDNYIEADSFKEISRRCYVILRPAVRMSPLLTRQGRGG